MKTFKTNILTPDNDKTIVFLPNVYLTIDDSKIHEISPEEPKREYQDYSHTVCIPGFIDTHVHLSQLRVRGKHSHGLLSWLNEHIFPEELKSESAAYSSQLAEDFFFHLSACGTTTSVVYVAPFPSACDNAFKAADNLGVRSIIGQTLMDINCPEYLCRSTDELISETETLFREWNNRTPLLDYIITPRFAPVCSAKLMHWVGEFSRENNAYIQTHLAENKSELEWVKQLFPQYDNYSEVYAAHNMLGAKTLLGHCIHLSDGELALLRDTESKITHCPDSNFFLHSGTFPLKRVIDHGVPFALASDVGAGTSLYMPAIMKMFIYRQTEHVPSLADCLYYCTLGAAKILGKEKIIGSIEKGKEADLVFIELPPDTSTDAESILSWLVYLSDANSVFATYTAGKEIYSKKA
jgi:guanine deaminase